MTTTTPTESNSTDHVESFFDYIFGDGVLPVRTFDDVQDELDFLEGGSVYATSGTCQVCAQRSPFVVSSKRIERGDGEGRLWRATCFECFSQVRIPASVNNENEWQLHDEEAEIVGLEPVPTYQEAPLDVAPEDGAPVEEDDAE